MAKLDEDTIRLNKDYFVYLEKLRKSGRTNMWGASPYLQVMFPELHEKAADNILLAWIQNYDQLSRELNFAEVR